MIKSVIRYSVYENKRKDVANIVNMIKKRSDQVSDELYHILDKVPKMNDDEGTWRKFSRSSVRLLKKMQKGIHLRARTKWRGQMKKWKYKRDEQRKNQQEVKKYYNYALKRKPPENKPTVLFEKRQEELHMIEGKTNIFKKEIEFSKKTHGVE